MEKPKNHTCDDYRPEQLNQTMRKQTLHIHHHAVASRVAGRPGRRLIQRTRVRSVKLRAGEELLCTIVVKPPLARLETRDYRVTFSDVMFRCMLMWEPSRQPMYPHSAHLRRCNHHPPRAKHSTQPVPLGLAAGLIPSLSDFTGSSPTSSCFSRAGVQRRTTWPPSPIDEDPSSGTSRRRSGCGRRRCYHVSCRLAVSDARLALAHFYNVTIRIANVAARLAVLVLWLCDKLCSSASPLCVARLNICNADIHKAAD